MRNKYYAHREVSDAPQTTVLFSKGTKLELQEMCAFLGSLYRALWQLFFNGMKPALLPARQEVVAPVTKANPGIAPEHVIEGSTISSNQDGSSAGGVVTTSGDAGSLGDVARAAPPPPQWPLGRLLSPSALIPQDRRLLRRPRRFGSW